MHTMASPLDSSMASVVWSDKTDQPIVKGSVENPRRWQIKSFVSVGQVNYHKSACVLGTIITDESSRSSSSF